jgi:hypothetical protein
MVVDFCKVLEQDQNIVFAVEVPFMNRSADLVYYKDEKITVVEFKLHDWKKAIMQAKIHALGANEVYICLPAKPYKDKIEAMRSMLEGNQCGLILFDIEKKEYKIELPSTASVKWYGGVAIMKKGVEFSQKNGNYKILTGNV